MDKLLEYLKRRANSTFLVAASTFWAILHWKGLVVLFFVDQNLIMDKFGLLKNEYLAQEFFGFHVQTVSWELCYEIIIFFLPFILAYMYVWWLPKFITNPCYKKETEYKIERRITKLNADCKVEEAEAKKLRAKTKNTRETVKLVKAEKELAQNTPQTAWTKEYNDFRQKYHNATKVLSDLEKTIYKHQGRVDRSSSTTTTMTTICHINGLVDLTDNPIEGTKIELTTKGKTFLREYEEEKQ